MSVINICTTSHSKQNTRATWKVLITFNLFVTLKSSKAKSLHKTWLQIWPQEQSPKECFSEYRSNTWPSDSQSDTSANIRNLLDTLQLLPYPRDSLQKSFVPRYYLNYGARSLQNLNSPRIPCSSNDNSDIHLLLTVIWESKGLSLMLQPTQCWPHPEGLSWTFHFLHPLSVSYQEAWLPVQEHTWCFADSSRSPRSSGSPSYRHTAAGTCCSLGSLLSRPSLKQKADESKNLSDNKPQVSEPPILSTCFLWMADAKLFMIEEMVSFRNHGRPLISTGLLSHCTPKQYISLWFL